MVITAFAAGFIESLANLTVTDAEQLSIARWRTWLKTASLGI